MYEHIYMRAHMQAHTHKHMYVLTHAGKYTDSHNSRQAGGVYRNGALTKQRHFGTPRQNGTRTVFLRNQCAPLLAQVPWLKNT